MVRYCKQFLCIERGEKYCCAGCYMRDFCSNPCLNHPSRCRLEDTEHEMIKRRGHRGPYKKKTDNK